MYVSFDSWLHSGCIVIYGTLSPFVVFTRKEATRKEFAAMLGTFEILLSPFGVSSMFVLSSKHPTCCREFVLGQG